MNQPRRWVSEDAVLAEMERLNAQSMQLVSDFAIQAPEAAQAEATHKTLRAQRVLQAKASGIRGINECEYHAEADQRVADAYWDRLTKAAILDATREALRSIRTNQDALRTAAASARDGVVGPGWKGNHNV